MSKEYILIKVEERYSHKNFNTYHLLTFVDTETGELLECSVDSMYDNWTRWRDIIQDTKPLGIYGNLKLSKRTSRVGKRIISADSHPRCSEKLSDADIATVMEVLKELKK